MRTNMLLPSGLSLREETDYARSLSPQSELDTLELGERVEWDTLELGERVEWELFSWRAVSIYSRLEDRVRSATVYLVGTVAKVTSWRDLPYPAHLWPPSAEDDPSLD